MERRFSGCEVAEIGIQIEINGKEFYLTLAENAENEEAKTIFNMLAKEEERHIGAFKAIEASECNFDDTQLYPDEYFSHLNLLASEHVFTEAGKGIELAKEVKSCKEGIDLALRFEKESVALFESMLNLVPEKDKEMVKSLIEEEKKHIDILADLRGAKEGYEKS
jgi:rubrerythrin